MDNLINQGFKPLINDNSEILILGSFPSVKSRQNNFYYGNPQNRLWKVLAEYFKENTPKSIEEKIELCKKHKVALWDVVVSSNINGSSDDKLEKSDIEIADLHGLLKKFTCIKRILCNGKLAYNLYLKYFSDIKIEVLYMPSTSPANVRFDSKKWELGLNILN